MITALYVITGLLAVVGAAKMYLCHMMRRSYELGHRLGRISATQGQDWIDDQLILCGLDPTKLPGRSDDQGMPSL